MGRLLPSPRATLAVLTTAVFGTIIAWVLVRDSFAGKSLVNAIIDLPFALPTIVAGLVIMALYGPRTPLDVTIGSFHFDADITFTLSMPGIPTVTIDGKTAVDGTATFSTTIPKGADVGQGSATVLVTSKDFGSTEDYTVISIVR